MSQSPTNNCDSPVVSTFKFIPKDLPSHKDAYGISRTVFTHVSHLHVLFSEWIRIQEKGTKMCKSISALKLHECADNYYPQVLKPLTESLVEALDSLKNIVDGVAIVDKQLQALAKLQPSDDSVISTWSAKTISKAVTELHQALYKEFMLKQTVTENLAHCRDENLIEVYVSSWEFDVYLDLQANTSYLFAEVGLTGIT